MNKRQVVASLNKIANQLDNNGLYQEANSLTNVMKKLAYNFDDEERKFEERELSRYDKSIDHDSEFGDYSAIGKLEESETMLRYKDALNDPNSEESNGMETRLTESVYRLLEEALMATPLEGDLRKGDTYDDLEDWVSGRKSLVHVFEDREVDMDERQN